MRNNAFIRPPGCAVGGGLSSAGTTDDTGHVTLQLQAGFFGYFLIDAGADYFPVIAYSSQPMYRVATSFTLNIFQRSWLNVLATMLQSEVHSDAGHVIFRAQNCLPLRFATSGAATSAYASGVTVSYSRTGANSTRVFYTIGGLMVDPSAAGTTLQGNGYGGAFNLPAGQTSIVGSHANTDVINAGIPLRAGRLFDERDVDGASPLALISEALAAARFPGIDPIGQRLPATLAIRAKVEGLRLRHTIAGSQQRRNQHQSQPRRNQARRPRLTIRNPQSAIRNP